MSSYVRDNEKRIVILPIEPPPISQSLQEQAKRDGFQLKDEFHMTVLYTAAFEELGESGFRTFADRLEERPMPNYTFADEVYYITKSKTVDGTEYPRESLVVPVISSAIETDLAIAEDGLSRFGHFLHVTLFTKQDNEHARTGIGIPSAEEWRELQPKIYFKGWQTQ